MDDLGTRLPSNVLSMPDDAEDYEAASNRRAIPRQCHVLKTSKQKFCNADVWHIQPRRLSQAATMMESGPDRANTQVILPGASGSSLDLSPRLQRIHQAPPETTLPFPHLLPVFGLHTRLKHLQPCPDDKVGIYRLIAV